MDAIRKKMQSLKAETDGLYATIQKFEDATKEYNRQADQVSRALNSFHRYFWKAALFSSKSIKDLCLQDLSLNSNYHCWIIFHVTDSQFPG